MSSSSSPSSEASSIISSSSSASSPSISSDSSTAVSSAILLFLAGSGFSGTTFSAGRLRRVFKEAEKAGIVHARIGKISFGSNKLRDNAWALLELVQKLKPSTAKGAYMRSIAVSTTLSPGIKVDVNEVTAKFAEA